MRALLATARGALQEAGANRAALSWQMAVMVVNDVVWIVFWALFFDRVGELNGWDLQGLILLNAVLTTAGGITLGLLADARRIGALVVEGGLDPVLALPVPTLPHLLVRRVMPTNLGDLAFGVTLFAVAGDPTPGRTAVFVLVTLTATVLLTAFLVLIGSLAFFVGRSETGEIGFHAMLLLAAYPADLFGGGARLLLYTVIPAAFVTTVPVRLVNDFDLADAALLLTVSGVAALAALATFQRGLRRYTSGAVWTQA